MNKSAVDDKDKMGAGQRISPSSTKCCSAPIVTWTFCPTHGQGSDQLRALHFAPSTVTTATYEGCVHTVACAQVCVREANYQPK